MLTFNHPKFEKVGKRIFNLIRSVSSEFRLYNMEDSPIKSDFVTKIKSSNYPMQKK